MTDQVPAARSGPSAVRLEQAAGKEEVLSEAELAEHAVIQKSKSSKRSVSATKSASDAKRRTGRQSVRETDGLDRQAFKGGTDRPSSNEAGAAVSTAVRSLWRHRQFTLNVMLLLATVWLGWTANNIVRAQTKVTESIGREHNQTALLQGFITATQGAGLESEREQRMLQLSIVLYLELTKHNRYTSLSASIPVPTDFQLQEILEGKAKSDRDAILQLYGRASDIDIVVVPANERGIFHVAIATFENRLRAIEFVKSLAKDLRPKTAQPLYVIQNRRGLYLILMGGFTTSDEASRKAEELGLAKQFQGVYVTQWRDWTEICGSAGGGLPCAAEQ